MKCYQLASLEFITVTAHQIAFIQWFYTQLDDASVRCLFSDVVANLIWNSKIGKGDFFTTKPAIPVSSAGSSLLIFSLISEPFSINNSKAAKRESGAINCRLFLNHK